jgi:hypothetical protein
VAGASLYSSKLLLSCLELCCFKLRFSNSLLSSDSLTPSKLRFWGAARAVCKGCDDATSTFLAASACHRCCVSVKMRKVDQMPCNFTCSLRYRAVCSIQTLGDSNASTNTFIGFGGGESGRQLGSSSTSLTLAVEFSGPGVN